MEPKKTVIRITEPCESSGEFLQVLKFEFPETPYPTEYHLQRVRYRKDELLTVLNSLGMEKREFELLKAKV